MQQDIENIHVCDRHRYRAINQRGNKSWERLGQIRPIGLNIGRTLRALQTRPGNHHVQFSDKLFRNIAVRGTVCAQQLTPLVGKLVTQHAQQGALAANRL